MSLLADHVASMFADLTRDDLDDVLAAVRNHFGVAVAPVDPALAPDWMTYLQPGDRFVAALVASYDETRDGVGSVEEAAEAALALTRGEGSDGTHWWVYDRQEGSGRVIEQSQFEDFGNLPFL